MKDREPQTLIEFDDLARKLARVPKKIVLTAEARYEKRKQERKKKKS